MNEHRSVLRWCAGLLLAGAVLVGVSAPAQADTGWNGTLTSAHHTSSHHLRPADTGWNGT